MSYHPFKSACGPNWEDLDDDDLEVFAPDKDETVKYGECDNANDCADHEDVYEADLSPISPTEYFPEDDTPYCLNVAALKHYNEVWDVSRSLPAYPELSFDDH